MKTAFIVVFFVLLFLLAVFFICSFVFFKMAAGREKREFKISDGMVEKRGLVSEKEEIYKNLSKWDSLSKEDVFLITKISNQQTMALLRHYHQWLQSQK